MSNTSQIADQAVMEAFFRSHLDLFLGATELVEMTVARHHQAYIFDPSVVLVEYKLVLKINGENQKMNVRGSTDNGGKRLKHYHILKSLSEVGFDDGKNQVPQPLGYFPEMSLLLYKNVSGESLYDKLQYKPESEWTQKVWDAINWLSDFHSKLRAVPEINFNPEEESLKFDKVIQGLLIKYPDRAESIKDIYQLIKKCEKETVDRQKFVLIHGDFHPANLIFSDDPDRVYGIDFNDAMLYDELYDLAYFTTQTHQMLQRVGLGKRTEFIQEIINHYLTKRKIEKTDDLERKLTLFRIKTLLHIKAVSPHHLAANIYEEIKNYHC